MADRTHAIRTKYLLVSRDAFRDGKGIDRLAMPRGTFTPSIICIAYLPSLYILVLILHGKWTSSTFSTKPTGIP